MFLQVFLCVKLGIAGSIAGSAHDCRVLNDAYVKGLVKFTGRYYLGDAGYALSWHVFTPYRGVRYHLKEWARGNQKPQNRRELFNLRHASCRNMVERGYGVTQARLPVLTNMRKYPYEKQVDITITAFCLHNFIRMNQEYEDAFDHVPIAPELVEPLPPIPITDPNHNTALLNQWRDGIAQQMWDDYTAYILLHPNYDVVDDLQ